MGNKWNLANIDNATGPLKGVVCPFGKRCARVARWEDVKDNFVASEHVKNIFDVFTCRHAIALRFIAEGNTN